MICPVCGHQFSDDPLLHILERIQRNNGIIETKAVAAELNYTQRMVQYKFKMLESAGVIFRYGQRKGWFLRT